MIAPLRLYASIIGAVAALSAVLALGWTVSGWRADAARLASVEAERDQVRAELASVRAEADRQRQIADAAVGGYLEELARLRTRRGSLGAVRLCPDPAADVPGPARPAGPADGGPAAAGRLR